jgi:3-hydroxyisobutyrate dehydrogenase
MAHIAFLGTGLLGSAFAEAATKRGDTVVAWNRSPQKVEALASFGVKAAATPVDAVRGATRVHLVLKDDAVVEEVIAAARPGLATDTVLIDHSTTLPALTTDRAARLKAAGVNYLHCPVFMGPPAARNAQGTMLVSGPEALYDMVKEDLAKMTSRVEYLGERQDLAAAQKLLGNAMIIGLAAVMADVLTLAQANAVDGKDAIAVLKLLDLNAMVNGRGSNMANGNFAPSFELSMARKDIGLMLEAAGKRPLATLPGIEARMDELIAQGHGASDACVLGIDALSRD